MQMSRDRFLVTALFCALTVTAVMIGYFIWQDARSDTVRIEFGDEALEITEER